MCSNSFNFRYTIRIVPFIIFTFISTSSKTLAENIPVTLFIDPSISNADAIFEQAKAEVLQFSPNVTLENLVSKSGPCGELESDTKDIFSFFQNYHAKNYRITMGPTCSANFLRFANLTAEIQSLQINILKGYPYDHPTMIDMITRSPQNLAENLVAALKGLEWAQVGVVMCEECYEDDEMASEKYFSTVQDILADNNIAIKETLKLKKGESSQNISQEISVFESSTRVLLLFLGNDLTDYVEFLSAMSLKNYTTEEYTPVIVLSKNSLELVYPWKNDVSTIEVFDKTFIIHNNCYDKNKISSFLSKYSFSSLDETIISLQMYEAYHLLGYYLSNAITNTTLFNYVTPEKSISSMDIHGPFGEIYVNTNGQRVAGYDVKFINKTQTDSNFVTSLGTVGAHKNCPRLACLRFVINSTSHFESPKDVPLCGFHGEICDQTGVIYAILVIVAAICLFLLFYISIKRFLISTRGRSVSNPWLIPFTEIRFIDLTSTEGSMQMSIQSLQQKIAEREHFQQLARTKLIATVDQSYVLVDKFVVRDKIRYEKNDINILYQMKSQLQHDNLNTFVGFANDKLSHIYIIWQQCFRGSLHDHIFTKERRREAATNFEGAFLRDILKGMDFLHNSSLEYHGNLTLQNCLLDSHWIVKLSGFGTNRLLVKWKASGQIFTEDHTPIIKSEELHYFDPALKKIWKSLTGTKQDKYLVTPEFGRKCDMYSFGVLLYEICLKKKFVPDLTDIPRDDDESVLIDDQNDAQASKYPLPIVLPDGVDMHNDLIKMLENCFGTNRPDVKLARKIIDTVLKMQGSLVDLMIKNLTIYTAGLHETVRIRTLELEEETRKNDVLLFELLPKEIAYQMKRGEKMSTTTYKHATILYSDIVGFTSLCSESEPIEVVTLLSGMYQRFDLIISQQGGYKMETIGDAYCVAGGLPMAREKEHIRIICMIALLQRDCLHHFEIPHRPGRYLNCRWGFNSGQVFAGVIGISAPRYACFGEAVMLASKMESNGKEDRIQLTLYSKQLLEDNYPEFTTSPRGNITVDTFGHLLTYWLEGIADGSELKVKEYQDALNEDLTKVPAWKDGEEPVPSVLTVTQKDRITRAKEKVLAEKKQLEERLKRQMTLNEILEDHEEEVEMNVVLRDDDDKHSAIDLASILSAPLDDEDEEEEVGRVIGHGRLDSQASTIPEN
ncbi:CRE-DAF-11 protein [Caenorhabditis remanei]|uniref:guanylate cyclase n=1 Tax=Caenorhabditis remanei TaxID=31234 RepID=E3LPQ0_CAERE|nr:CRE-DAF-11 protein [Caenorhabditis remanei]